MSVLEMKNISLSINLQINVTYLQPKILRQIPADTELIMHKHTVLQYINGCQPCEMLQ